MSRTFKNIDAGRYFELINKSDRTKEESRELETLKHIAKTNSVAIALDNLINNMRDTEGHPLAGILEYDKVDNLYRLQVVIKGKMKTIARIKAGKKDIYILVRETTAKALDQRYELINYNLPAGYYIPFEKAYTEFYKIAKYHYDEQTA